MSDDFLEALSAEDRASRKEFEQWYTEHAFDYAANPVGSPECELEWAAWKAGREALRADAAQSDDAAEGWMKWGGGESPFTLTDPYIDYICRNGEMGKKYKASFRNWGHTGSSWDIVKFRISKDQS